MNGKNGKDESEEIEPIHIFENSQDRIQFIIDGSNSSKKTSSKKQKKAQTQWVPQKIMNMVVKEVSKSPGQRNTSNHKTQA